MITFLRILALKQELSNIWNNYYNDTDYSTTHNQQNPSISSSIQNMLIYQCLFKGLQETCIKSTSNDAKILHVDCVFNNIWSENSGSLVYIESTASNIAQRRFEAYNCYSSVSAGVAYIFPDQTTTLSYTEESSIAECGQDSVNYIFYNKNGNVKFSYINFSKNCFYTDGFYIDTQSFDNITYSTIEENNANKYSAFAVLNGNDYSMKYCNVFRNYQVSTRCGTIYAIYTELYVYNNSFISDKGNGKLFYASTNAKIKIYNSYIDSTTDYGSVSSINSVDSMTVSLNYSDFSPNLIITNQTYNYTKIINPTYKIQVDTHRMRNRRF
ncbi:hypothetical protein TVAG_185460 [Trichomonas vaginalis G3]|uniref:Right handed beta helix domain-containing protein n=1 Tax=Trichomonas vaginalis (strain ATCC PRA-98 / G3) TaxID=412133 RepID=A2D8J1_TRIV3|nr:hypothetical protein TVAGG3_0392900 [Trichomonas vaginalis G3]EAY23240.1 hypothetical protein TVAG_185460 [Trichomonas vaginalis G3]KAI5534111.1 hypothetical protein TVAGG3_0392900 [Trichomonas vaginalis G3]|eukprot:XP_001584226.1 hypothetical protein [Trichomonas vaginalis G3]